MRTSDAWVLYARTIVLLSRRQKTPAKYDSWCMLFVIAITALFYTNSSYAQTVSISYPSGAAAQSLTRSYSSGLLTVRLSYSAACSGSTVTVGLPAGVQYVTGSILKSAGTGGAASSTITESSVTNSRRPVFTVSAVSGAGDLTFTISRTANCGASSSGKDSIYVSGVCGSASETDGSTNTYNIFTPALTQTGPATISNAYINEAYTRTFRITNGGNGCIDTLRLAIKRPLSMSGAVLKIGSTLITSFSTNADTSFYKISGANLPGGDNLMCNGEFIDFTEQFTLMDCASLSVVYLSSWGRPGNICTVNATTSTITMANGSANITGNSSRLQQLNWCRNGVFTLTFTNAAATTGGKANAAYSMLPNIGYSASGNTAAPTGNLAATRGRIDSLKIGNVKVPVIAATATVSAIANFPALTNDPDGTGVGLDDLDGDGQYDDLAPGKSVMVTVYEHWDNSVANTCPTPQYTFYNSYLASYSAMCGTSYTTNALSASNLGSYRILANNGGFLTTPAEIAPNVPFTVQACVNLSGYASPYAPVDSLYFDIILPTGLSVAPSPDISYNGVAVTAAGYYTDTISGVRTLHIRRKGRTTSFCYSLSLIYDCTGSTTVTPQFNIRYQGDTCSQSIEYHMCKSASIKVSCPGVCTEGIRNYLPSARRLTLGYTDLSLSTKVSASAVTGLAVYTALALDTIQIIVPGKQLTTQGSYSNLYYNLQLGKMASADVFQFISGTFNQVSNGTTTSNVIGLPATTASTTTLQKLSWNLSTYLKNGTITNGDSVWLDLRFVVTRANSDALYANTLTQVPNTSSTLYNRSVTNVAVGCDTAHAINLLVTGNASVNSYTPPTSLNSCGSATILSSEYFGNATGLDIFPAEYRPQVIIDSVLITLPAGYVLSGSYNQYTSRYWNSLVTYGSNPVSTTGTITQTSANSWMVKNPYTSTGGWTTADLGNTGASNYSLGYQVFPTCASVTGTQNYTVKWFYRDFVYTGNPVNYASKNNTNTTTLTYNSTVVPSLSLQNNTGTVQGVLPQHYWDIQLNSNGNGTPLYTWMALDRLSSGISIDSVIYDGTNITNSGTAYATNKTWYQLTATGISSGVSKAARIYFKYINCTADSIKVLAGWNCIGYPSPDPSANTCSEISQFLKILPLSSQIQLSILRQPGNGSSIALCNPDSVSAIINSASGSNVDNPVVSITPPSGLTIVTPIAVEYPLGSGIWQSLTPTLNAGVYTINLENHTGIGAAGLKGVTAAGGVSANRQAKVVVQYAVSCAFVANSLIGFNVYGATPCGATAIGNGNRVNSNGVAITGATVAGSAGMTINAATTDFSCGDAASTVSFNVTPLGGIATTAGDVAVYSLPAGLGYVANSFARGSNCAGCTLTLSSGSGGTTDLTVSLAQGVTSGSTMAFSVQVQPTIGAGCTGSITGAFRRNTAALSCNGTLCSVSQAIIASASQAITIKKPQLDITSIVSTNACFPDPGYLCSYDISFKNNGTAAATANTYKAEFFCSGNTSTPLYVYTLPSAIAVGASGTQTVSFGVPISCYGQQLSVKISPVTVSSGPQCLCSESVNQLAIILPVKLVSFDGVLKNGSVNLTWKVANEEKLKHYIVERSTNGLNFTTISRMQANNSAATSTYTTTDNHLPADLTIVYYRLQMVDADGTVTYSSILSVRLKGSNEVMVLVKPNPVKNSLQVLLPVDIQLSEIRLVDATGQSVISSKGKGGSNIINTTLFANGMYVLQVLRNQKIIYTQKILKQ